ncbi:hypothetical protein [uncultured Draconibacterium sp.]|uniref:hypothetical protein n=1 Tax=uncultured Draconibacterium sp. TaxID=1573823 RepID=UPI00326111A2
MKTIGTFITIILLIFAVNIVSASGNLKVNFASSDADLTVVEISNSNFSTIEIEVTDDAGRDLYSMKTKAPLAELNKRYNFSNLEEGIYYYRVKIDSEEVRKRLAVENGTVHVESIRKSVEPYFVHDENLLKFTFLNYQNEDVKVYVYDSKQQLLAEADLGNDFSIQRAIPIKELRKGNYSVVISNDEDVFEYDFTL